MSSDSTSENIHNVFENNDDTVENKDNAPANDETDEEKESAFVNYVLGIWSSHPQKLAKQFLLFFTITVALFLLIAGLVAVMCYLSIWDFTTLINLLLKSKVPLFTSAIFVSFVIMTNILLRVAYKFGSSGNKISRRDELPVPYAGIIGISLLWLIVWALYYTPYFKARPVLQYFLDGLCVVPFLCLMIYLFKPVKKKKKKKKRCIWFLVAAILLFCVAGYTFCPERYLIWKFTNETFRLGVRVWSLFLGIVSLISFFFIRFLKEEAGGEGKKEDDVSQIVQFLGQNLPSNVRIKPFQKRKDEKEIINIDFLKMRLSCFVPKNSSNVPEADFLYNCIMGFKSPTFDQMAFFERFIGSYEELQKSFLENQDPKQSMFRADIILQGCEGSGKTEALLGAALYSAIVRGQRVLYVVKDNFYAEKLSDKINDRLKRLYLDCYYFSTVLKKLGVDSWVETMVSKDELLQEGRGVSENPFGDLPADIIFATPETIESVFFCNPLLGDDTRKAILLQMLLSFNVILIDDLTDLELTHRSHLAFVMDKIRLLMASNNSLCQFVVGTAGIYEPYGVEKLAERLFGLYEFNRQKNVLTLHPRESNPFWFCRLKVSKGKKNEIVDLNDIAIKLAKTGVSAGKVVLLFYRGIGRIGSEKIKYEILSDATPVEVVVKKTQEDKTIDTQVSALDGDALPKEGKFKKYIGKVTSWKKAKEKTPEIQPKKDLKIGEIFVCEKCPDIEDIDVKEHPVKLVFYVSKSDDIPTAAIRSYLDDNPNVMPVFFSISYEDDDVIDELEIEELGMPLPADSSDKQSASSGENTEVKKEEQWNTRKMICWDQSKIVLLPDETAIALRAWHLRTALPFISKYMPIESNIWSHFGINKTHPCMREIEESAGTAMHDAIQWLNDGIDEDDLGGEDAQKRYPEDVIWSYLVLRNSSTISGQGKKVDFDMLPNDNECIWLMRRPNSPFGDTLTLGLPPSDGKEKPKHLALWKDGRGVPLWTSDMTHASELLIDKKQEEGEKYVVSEIRLPDKSEDDTYALTIRAKYSNILKPDKLIPVIRLNWELKESLGKSDNSPKGSEQDDLKVVIGTVSDEIATFALERKNSQVFRVNGVINGIIDKVQADEARCLTCNYSFDAYISCLVLKPNMKHEDSANEDGISERDKEIIGSVAGKWDTVNENMRETSDGRVFSSMLSHALAACLKRRFSGWDFFTKALAFSTPGNQAIGEYVIWFVEPFNSGRTGYSVLSDLLREDEDFRKSLFNDLSETVCKYEASEQSMRRNSGIAYICDNFNEKERDALVLSLSNIQNKNRKEVPPVDPKQFQEFNDVLVKGYSEFAPSIDVSRFTQDYNWSIDQINYNCLDVLWNNPQLFYMTKQCNTVSNELECKIVDIRYPFGKDEFEIHRQELEQEVSKVLDLVSQKCAGLQEEYELAVKVGGEYCDEAQRMKENLQVAQALAIHDYIVETCEYDVKAAEEKDGSPLARTAYSVLVRHLAVCEGYVMGYRYLLDKVGIRSEEVLSEALNHCWSYLFIGKHWYHVDVTWDDPVFSNGQKSDGTIIHDNFLMSDAKARRTPAGKPHTSWSVRGLPPAYDRRYDGRIWG